MSEVPVITIPRVVYDVLVGQAQANARALQIVLTDVQVKGRTIQSIKMYRALTGTTLFQAKNELDEWAAKWPRS